MSATFKNAKKKHMQSELRKFMNEHKEKQQKKKIESPLAKYNESGQLTCILCQSVVRSEGVWNVHINSKQHKTNIERAKELKEKTNNFTVPASKRPAQSSHDEVETKKPRGILKNAPKVNIKSSIEVVESPRVEKADVKQEEKPKVENVEEKMQVDSKSDEKEALPEGFFDDPKMDAKARNIEYKDPIEEEWEKFQKAIKDDYHESAKIIAEDQEEATNERQIDEIEEQMKNWSRVLDLEKKKVEVVSQVNDTQTPMDEDLSSSGEEDIDEFPDWRSKSVYK